MFHGVFCFYASNHQVTTSSNGEYLLLHLMYYALFSPQIFECQDFEEFPDEPLDSLQVQDGVVVSPSQPQPVPSGLDRLGQHLELELGLGAQPGVAPGAGVISGAGAGLGSGLGLELGSGAAMGSQTGMGSSLGAEIDFGSFVCTGAGDGVVGAGASTLDLEAQRRLSLQEPQTPLDSRTPQRHSSDPGGS